MTNILVIYASFEKSPIEYLLNDNFIVLFGKFLNYVRMVIFQNTSGQLDFLFLIVPPLHVFSLKVNNKVTGMKKLNCFSNFETNAAIEV